MHYPMTAAELTQALHRLRIAAGADVRRDRDLIRGLLILSKMPGMDRYVAENVTAEQVARLDWALEREPPEESDPTLASVQFPAPPRCATCGAAIAGGFTVNGELRCVDCAADPMSAA